MNHTANLIVVYGVVIALTLLLAPEGLRFFGVILIEIGKRLFRLIK